MNDDRQNEAELQYNFYLLACSLQKVTAPIFTKILHDIVALYLKTPEKCSMSTVQLLIS